MDTPIHFLLPPRPPVSFFLPPSCPSLLTPPIHLPKAMLGRLLSWPSLLGPEFIQSGFGRRVFVVPFIEVLHQVHHVFRQSPAVLLVYHQGCLLLGRQQGRGWQHCSRRHKGESVRPVVHLALFTAARTARLGHFLTLEFVELLLVSEVQFCYLSLLSGSGRGICYWDKLLDYLQHNKSNIPTVSDDFIIF